MIKSKSNKSKKGSKRKSNKNKSQVNLNKEILGIIIISIGIFILVSLYSNDGILGNFINETLSKLTGVGSYIIPYIIIIIGILYVINKLKIKENKKTAIILLLYVSLLILLSRYGDNGGKIGNYFSEIYIKIFGELKSYIIIYSSILIMLIMLTDISFIKLIKNGYEKLDVIFRKIISYIKARIPTNTSDVDIKIFNHNENKDYNKDEIVNKLVDDNTLDEKIKILDYTKNIEYNQISSEEKNIENETPISDKENIEINNTEEYKDYLLPCLDILDKGNNTFNENEKKLILDNAQKLENILKNFGIDAEVIQISKGPTITRYELQPAPGVKVSKIVNLSNDIALGLASSDVRIEAPIPGKSAIGIEVPNVNKSVVRFRDVLESKDFQDAESKLTFAIGKDIAGKTIIGNIETMPHLLVAGATGSGKSVCINTLISSILYKSKPNEVKLLLIDPKVVELSIYNGIPHLLTPVVTDPRKAAGALNWGVQEMTRRYNMFAKKAVRDFKSYNSKVSIEDGDEKLPQIIIIIDELADLMMVSPNEVEESICRIAQMARAAGMHLILATQRPSVDVITGTIKANIPSRLAFAVSSQVDSRTILDMSGAEKLLGKGDMLFYPVGESKPKRIQGAFISDNEVETLVEFLKEQSEVDYKEEIVNDINESINTNIDNEVDQLFTEAVKLVVDEGQASISFLQRKLKIGYSRAARIVDEMEEKGIVGGHEGSKPRKVLINNEDLEIV